MFQHQAISKKGRLLVICLCLCATGMQAQTIVFPFGTSWKYLDNGTNQATTWRAVAFSDVSWKQGNGQLGYGDGDEATVLSYGSNSTAKYTTSYFRKAFTISGKNSYTSFKIESKRDDGMVIYVNGTEVNRSNMPSGSISYTTLASSAASDDGSAIQSVTVTTSFFAEGNNVIAVEIHQNAKTSSDISFDMRLTGNLPAPPVADSITRGPYLQMGNQAAITIRWSTNKAVDSRVKWGTVFGSLGNILTDTTKATTHEMRLTGLTSDTKYYYGIGTGTAVLEETNKNYFNTAPPATATRKIRITAFGDCGDNSANQVNVKNAYLNYMGTNATDLWLLLGDNAYNSGTDAEFQSKFFNIYKDNLLKNVTLFPALGNHEYANSPTLQDNHAIPYLSLFTLPKNGESGGLASGKEEYYSFDYGDIHFISLDSYGEEQNKRFYDTTGPQITWLKADLAANQRKWTIAYWHHPPYTMGSSSSDTDPDLASIRTKLIRILERNGVDLILAGHSHVYERSYLLHDHFGLENTFSFTGNTSGNSNARYDGGANSCPYTSTSAKTKHGTVYVVSGSAGRLGGTQSSWPHAAMYYSNATTGGSLAIEIEGNRLDAKFVATDNTIKDQFTIFKDVNKTTTLSVAPGQPVLLSASWTGNYSWNTGTLTRSVTVSQPIAGTYNYYVSDQANAANKCLSDTFRVTVVQSLVNGRPAVPASFNKEIKPAFSFRIYPRPSKGGKMQVLITSPQQQNMRYQVTDLNGRIIRNNTLVAPAGISRIELSLPTGLYLLKLGNATGNHKTEKILVE